MPEATCDVSVEEVWEHFNVSLAFAAPTGHIGVTTFAALSAEGVREMAELYFQDWCRTYSLSPGKLRFPAMYRTVKHIDS